MSFLCALFDCRLLRLYALHPFSYLRNAQLVYSLFDIAPSPESSLRVVFVKKLLLIFGSCDKEISGLLLTTGSRVCRVSESGVKDTEPGFKNRLAFSIIAANDNNNNRTS